MKYTKETLAELNGRYLSAYHEITDKDVTHVNELVKLLEATRNQLKPLPGDIVQYTSERGDYYGRAHIDNYTTDNRLYICEQPYVPFVSVNEKGKVGFCTSGGAWTRIPSALKLVGQEEKSFCIFGSCGPCADGSLVFQAAVNVWEYAEPAPLFGEYTTKTLRRDCITYREKASKNDCSPYHYIGNGRAFVTEKEYLSWLRTYKGVEFEGFFPNQTVVFFYRKKQHLIDKAQWDQLALPTDTRQCNGIILIKYRYDDEQHIIHEYRYTNSGSHDLKELPYRNAYQKLSNEPQQRIIHKKTSDCLQEGC